MDPTTSPQNVTPTPPQAPVNPSIQPVTAPEPAPFPVAPTADVSHPHLWAIALFAITILALGTGSYFYLNNRPPVTSPTTSQATGSAAPQSFGITSGCTTQDSYASLTSLPSDLSQVCSLRLNGLGLTSFPASVFRMTHLKELHLGSNALAGLPDQFSSLSGLLILSLNSNKLTSFPSQIEKLTQLQSLNLSGNQITSLPDWISNLTSLKLLYLTGNPISLAEQSRIRSTLPQATVIF